jgi:hypothetical protein
MPQSEARHYGESSCRDYRSSVLAALPHRQVVFCDVLWPDVPSHELVYFVPRSAGLCCNCLPRILLLLQPPHPLALCCALAGRPTVSPLLQLALAPGHRSGARTL